MAPPALATVHQWSHVFGDESSQVLYDLVADESGNAITTGHFNGTVNFGGGPLNGAGGRDIFVAKHGSNGAHIWSKGFGDGNNQYGVAAAVDGDGNVIVVGGFAGTVDFGGGPLTSAGDYDLFVVKFSPLGVHLWSTSFGDADYDMPSGVAVDDNGNVFIVGQFSGALDLGGGPLTSAGLRDVFLVRLTPLGVHAWSAGFGDADYDFARGIALDASGDPVIAGDFRGTIGFGGAPLTSAGSYDVYVTKFTATGSHLWSQVHGDVNYDSPRDIDLDSTDRVLLTGHFSGNIAFDPLPSLTSEGNHDVFLAKIGANGGGVWSKRFGDASSDNAGLVAVDGDDNVLIAGYFKNSIDFGLGPLTSASGYDVYLAKLNADGNTYWSEIFSNTRNQIATGLDTDAGRNILLAGQFDGTIDLGGDRVTSAGGYDIFITKLLPSDLPAIIGNRVWYDTDGDGLQESGEPGLDSVPVSLYNNIGSLVGFTLTGADGAYSFGGLSWTETYSLRFFPPIGYILAPQDQGGDDDLDSDTNPSSGFTESFTLLRFDDRTRWDTGLVPVVGCWSPDEPLYLYEITLTGDGNRYPVLNFMDPNQPEQVTGYNIYRSTDPGLPHENWSLVASNVIDMDEATPNKQWVDTSGDPGNWYYQVAAYNHHCPGENAEGPR